MAESSKVEGGEAFNAAVKAIVERFTNASSVSVGFLENATYPDGTPVALVAAVNEFGAPSRGQPPRPFFRSMIAAKAEEWPQAVAGLLRENDARTALEMTGAAIKGQLQESIANYNAGPPLKPSTIARKGFDKQLVDTGHMMNSVDYQVE